jgi:hypothetical protein
MNTITSYIGRRIRPGTIQQPLQFAVIESHSCGEQLWDSPFFSLTQQIQYRYLAKMCDQVIALLSPEYSASIVWDNDENGSESVDLYTDDTDRMFSFEVSKSNEQEENVVVCPGFQVSVSFVVEVSFLIR